MTSIEEQLRIAYMLAREVSYMLERTIEDVGDRGHGSVMMVKHYLDAFMNIRKESRDGHDTGAI